MTDPDRIAYAEARDLTIEAALHAHRGALRALLARAFDGGYAAGELAAQGRIRALEAERATHLYLLRLAHSDLIALDERITADLARGGVGVNILAEHRQSLRTLLRRTERAADIPAAAAARAGQKA